MENTSNIKILPSLAIEDKYIEVMTKEQIAFVDFAKVVFNFSDNAAIEQVAVRIRSKLKDIGYPIWSFKEIDNNGLEDFIDKLASLANPHNTGDSIAKTASAIGKMSIQTPSAAQNLATLLTEKNAPKAMKEFLKYFEKGEVLSLADEIGTTDTLLDVRRQVGSGEALWLWDKETGKDEIRKLLTDYKIVAVSNRINSKTSSLSACIGQWREKVKSIRIPCAALITEVPVLKVLFQTLRDIASSGELQYDKRKIFLTELTTKTNNFDEFFASKIDVFKRIYSFYLTGFNDDEVNVLYSKLPMDSFTVEKSDYEKNVAALTEKIRSEQEKYKLHLLWEEKTASKTPKVWSIKNKTPVLCLVPINLQSDARRVFDAVNRTNPENKEVKFALEFLQTKAAFLEDFSVKDKVDAAFIRDIIGKFSVLLRDTEAVRSHLESVIPSEPYYWYGNPAVQQEIEKFAHAKYIQGGSDKVLERIEKMDESKAKDYLKRLVKENVHVGVEIILEGDG